MCNVCTWLPLFIPNWSITSSLQTFVVSSGPAACGNPAPALHFQTLSGTLSVTRKQDGQRELLQMSLPLSAAVNPLPPQLQPSATCTPAAAAAAAGKADPADPAGDNAAAFSQLIAESPRLTELLYAALSSLPAAPAAPGAAATAADKASWLSKVVQHVGYVSGLKYLLVALQPGLLLGRQGLEALAPDAAELEAAGGADYLGGLIVSTLASSGARFRTQSSAGAAPIRGMPLTS
jgi:hypothetical protein